MVTEIKKDIPYYLEVIITDVTGIGILGLAIDYKIFKSDNNFLIESGIMIDIGNGIYQKGITLSDLGQYRILYTTPEKYDNVIETLIVNERNINDMTAVINKLDRILGLSGENKRLFDLVYDNNKNVISATIKIYANKQDANNDNNAIAVYKTIAEYNLNAEMINMKGIKE